MLTDSLSPSTVTRRAPPEATEWQTRQTVCPATTLGAVSPTWIESTAAPYWPLPPTAPVELGASVVPYDW